MKRRKRVGSKIFGGVLGPAGAFHMAEFLTTDCAESSAIYFLMKR